MHQREHPDYMASNPPYPLLADRPDVITFETPPLSEDIEITGPIEVHLLRLLQPLPTPTSPPNS